LRAVSKSSVFKLQLKTPNISAKQQLCDNEFQTEGATMLKAFAVEKTLIY